MKGIRFNVPKDPTSALNFVNGVRFRPKTQSTFPVHEPRTGELLCHCPISDRTHVDEVVDSAVNAFPNWAKLTGFERGKVLQKAAGHIRENLEVIAQWEVRDNGKPICEARVDIAGCADTFDYYGGVASTLSGEHIPLAGGCRFAYTKREPLGVVAGIGAWNYPFQTASWKMAPALACGNTFIYKPSPLAPITSTILADLLTHSGVPHGVISVVQGLKETGESLCTHDQIAKVSFTGSLSTGKAVMRSSAPKSVTLEMGGKSPLIIFDDVNIDNAVVGAMMANFFTQGEVCTNASRVFVHQNIVEEFTEKLIQSTRKMRIGDPFNEKTRIGASISSEHVEKVIGYIQGAKEQGASILFGGERVVPSGNELKNGYYLSPCIISNTDDSMDIVKEEVFGAVLLVIPFNNEEEVIRRANDTQFGLAAGLFTRDLKRAHQMADRLNAGTIYINTYNDVDVTVPFGGNKLSGFGRENGLAALNHYTQWKAVFVDTSEKLQSPF